jgi:eukaryotic-like serine/threonine-protein kinase
VDTQTSDHLVGRLLDGRYRVRSRVARGGMATVYRALDTRLDRVVAVKVMHGNLGDDEKFARKFVHEARSAARLSHPNVVAVFDQGDDDGTLFLAMEYVPGRTLRDLLRDQGPLSPARALDLLSPILSALSAAHDAGIVHRDVKPENVLITTDGKVKVADFGLARAVHPNGNTATHGLLMGTVSYLAPELVTDGSADARSDVYSAGIMLYEMLTGEKPHTGETPIQVAYQHVHHDVPPPSELQPGIPPYVDALVQRATARARELRPADAHVFSQQVRRVRIALDDGVPDDPELTGDLTVPILALAHEPEHTLAVEEPPPAPPPAGAPVPPERRSRGPLALILVLVLAVGVGGAAWYLGVQRFTSTPDLLRMTEAEARTKAGGFGLEARKTGEAFDESIPRGQVVGTDPGPGDRILKSGTVGLILSKGPERYQVPKLTGLDRSTAELRLSETNLVVGSVTEVYSETVPARHVVSHAPKLGQVVRRDTPVSLVVSKGKRPIGVPNLVGRRSRDATRSLDKLGFVVKTRQEFSDTVAQGRVIAQNPGSGTRFAGDTIELVVSKGPQVRPVPRVRGMRTGAARQVLERAGFRVEVKHDRFYFGLGVVVNQTPAGGVRTKAGTTVLILIV